MAPGLRLGEYEIEQVHSESRDSVLYMAYDHGLQRRVGLREYLPRDLAGRGPAGDVCLLASEHAERFARGLRAFAQEARLLARCSHPALVKVLRYWEARQTGYMAMPWYEGKTLEDSRAAMPHPPGEAWLRTLLLQLLGAVDVLHATFAQHREITPRNILIQLDGQPVLLGFHAARRALDEHGQANDPAFSAYLPIEAQSEGVQLQPGPWSDLYSLAALSHFCLTGSHPPSVAERTASGKVRPLSMAVRALGAQHPGLTYSIGFLSALDWAFELQPQHRPRSAAEWQVVLEQTALPPGTPLRNSAPAASAPHPMPGDPDLRRPAPVREGAQTGEVLFTNIPARAASLLPPQCSATRPAPSHRPASPPPSVSEVEPGLILPETRSELAARVPQGPAAPSSPATAPPPPSFTAPEIAAWPGASEEQGRASVAAALESLAVNPADAPVGVGAMRRGGRDPSEKSSRRWGWLAAAGLTLAGTATAWPWLQQHGHDSLSRILAGARISAPSPVAAPPEMPRSIASSSQSDAAGSAQDLSPAVPDLPDLPAVTSSPAPFPGPVPSTPSSPELPSPGLKAGALVEPPPPEVAAPQALARPAAVSEAAQSPAEGKGAPAPKPQAGAGKGKSADSGVPGSRPPPAPLAESEKRARPSPVKERGVAQSRSTAAPPVPAPVRFTSPRAACAPRERFSLYYCMQQQCKRSQFYQHRQCKVLRERDEIE